MRIITIDNVDYTLHSDHATATGFHRLPNGEAPHKIAIPERVKGLPVTRIDEDAFRKAGIKEVHIPDTVETIGAGAFAETPLSKVTGCKGLKLIAEYAFCDNRLTEFPFNEGLLRIETGAFFSYSFNIDHVVLPASLLTLDISAFTFSNSTPSSITMHGSTAITYDEEPDVPLHAHQIKFNILPPFTKTIVEGGAIMDADRNIVYAIDDISSLNNLVIPSSVRKMLPLCISHGIRITFEKGTTPLKAQLLNLDNVTVDVYRPLDLFLKYVPDSDDCLNCYAPVTIHAHVDDWFFKKITCYPGGSISFSILDAENEDECCPYPFQPNVVYEGEHQYVPVISCGKTQIPESTVKIGLVKAIKAEDYKLIKDAMDSHSITLRCTTPPQIERVERGALQPFTLFVPKGCVPVYSAHKQWGRCEIITDGFGTIIDRSKSQFSKANKREMLAKLAQTVADKLARATFTEAYTLDHEPEYSTLKIDLLCGNSLHPYVTFTQRIPRESLSNPDTWARLRAEVDHIVEFLSE